MLSDSKPRWGLTEVRALVVAREDGAARLALGVLAQAYAVVHEQVRSAEGLREALARERWDVLLCDPSQPICDDCPRPCALRAADGNSPPLIAVSLDEDEKRAHALIRDGARAVIGQSQIDRLVPTVERALADARVRQAQRLQALLEFSADPVVVVDSEGRIVRVNRLAEALLGYAEAELSGQRVEQLMPESRRARHIALREDYAAAPSIRPMGQGMEFPALHRDGSEIPVEISVAPIRAGGEALVCCALRDLRERRRAVKRTAQIEATNRELELFSHAISHDLRAVAAFSSLLTRTPSVRDNPEALSVAGRAIAAAVRMEHMLDELQYHMQLGLQTIEIRPVDLAAEAESLQGEFAVHLGARKVRWTIGELPVVQGDATLLRLALQNLIDNALKYSRTRDETLIEIGSRRVEGGFEIYVRDNGVGFDMAYAGKLFGLFQRLHTEREFEGTGIGLAHVKRIVERHGGSTCAEAAPGEGATFFFTLPEGVPRPHPSR
jgi:PAS domain S-box-containing protein